MRSTSATSPSFAVTALKDVLGFHSLAMNGGFSHSLEVDFGQASRAVEGFRLFGLTNAAGLINRVRALVAPGADSAHGVDLLDLPEASLAELDELEVAYEAEVDDAVIQKSFTAYLALSTRTNSHRPKPVVLK